jgi:hypothetical protein
MVTPFGVGGGTRKPRATVENTARIFVGDVARSLSTVSRAREGGEATASAIGVLINGKPEALDVVPDPRFFGGVQAFFLCPTCSRKCRHLYLRDDPRDGRRLACRRCSGVAYASQHTRRRGINRVRRLREKIGALPHVLAPIPQRPQHVRRDYWARALARIAAAETLVVVELRGIIPRVRQRLKHDRHRDRRARTA